MDAPGTTGFCSERCLQWSFFGVPALKEGDFIREIRHNQARKTENPEWTPPKAYPDLFSEEERKEIIEALALLKITCDAIR